MGDKGFSPAEIAALLGAHTSAKQFEFDPSHAGAPLDDTPGVWDVVSIPVDTSATVVTNSFHRDFMEKFWTMMHHSFSRVTRFLPPTLVSGRLGRASSTTKTDGMKLSP